MKKLMLVALLLVVGCKGKMGEKGDRGEPGTITKYVGFIASDDQNVFVNELGTNSNVSVYAEEIGGDFTELPFYSPPLGANVYYIASLKNVRIYNGLAAGLYRYKIVIINTQS